VELGPTLRKAREEQGRTLEEVQEYTKIRKEFLNALENENFGSLPPRVYTIGFIKKYASYLSIDPAPLISLLPDNRDTEPTLEPLATVGEAPRPWATWIVTGVIVFVLVAILAVRISQGIDSSSASQGIVVAQIPTAERAQSGDSSSPDVAAGQPIPTSTPAARTPTPAARPSLTPQPTSDPKLTVPALTGAQMELARSRLQSLGLTMNVEEVWSDSAPVGVLLDQKPPAGQQVSRGEFVLVLVSKGPNDKITVPNVIGMPEQQAQAVLTQARLANSPWVNYQGQEQVPQSVLSSVCGGCVLSTTPAPGQVVERGAIISMAVRRE